MQVEMQTINEVMRIGRIRLVKATQHIIDLTRICDLTLKDVECISGLAEVADILDKKPELFPCLEIINLYAGS